MIGQLRIQMPVQVGQLMAEAAGGQALPLCLKPAAIAVLGLNPHPLGALYIPPHAGHGQAALQAVLLPLLGNDFRVDQLQHLSGAVHHNHRPAENSHLGGRQPHAVCLGQRLLQVIQQHGQLMVELGDRVTRFIEYRVPLRQNRTNRHTIHSLIYLSVQRAKRHLGKRLREPFGLPQFQLLYGFQSA